MINLMIPREEPLAMLIFIEIGPLTARVLVLLPATSGWVMRQYIFSPTWLVNVPSVTSISRFHTVTILTSPFFAIFQVFLHFLFRPANTVYV